MQRKVLALLVLSVLICSSLIGCTQTSAPAATTAPVATAAPTVAPTVEPTATPQQPLTEITLPIVKEPLELTYFVEINTAELSYYSNLGDTPAAKEIAKRTGITMKFVHPPAGQGEEQFNLMVAGGELTDIVPTLFYSAYKGGVDAAIKDKLIIDVAPLVELYAPNFKQQILGNDIARKIVYNDNGTLTGFGCSVVLDREYGDGHNYVGPMVRKDLLEKSGLPLPETMDDWYNLLTKFKQMDVKIPFAWGHNGKDWDPMLGSFVFAAAYETAFDHGTQKGFYNNKGTIEYGPINEGYKKMVQMFAKWYADGLLNKDFATQTYLEHVKYQSSTGEAGAAVHHLFEYGTISADMDAKGYSMIPAPQPVLTKGQKLNFNSEGGWWVGAEGTYITTKCKTPEAAVKWIDWMYTEDAKTITNWGIEGESYVLKDGKPEFSEQFLADKTRMNMLYAPNALKFTVDSTQDDAQYNLPVQRDAWAMWGADGVYSTDIDYKFKPGMNFSEEENTRFAEIMTEVRTYAGEMFMKFIMGLEPLDDASYAKYVEKIKSLGVDEAGQIYQKVLDRYNSR